jgi:hypothetical protein
MRTRLVVGCWQKHMDSIELAAACLTRHHVFVAAAPQRSAAAWHQSTHAHLNQRARGVVMG